MSELEKEKPLSPATAMTSHVAPSRRRGAKNDDCPNEDLFTTFMQGAGTEQERKGIEQHLDGCEACRDLLAQLAETFVVADAGGTKPDGPFARARKKDDDNSLFGAIGRYELLDVVGRGAMGTVYEGRDPVLGRRIAIKIIEHSADSERLLREGRAMARVAHPNVVAVHDAGASGGRVFIAMDLIRGSSLREYLQSHPMMTSEARILLFVDCARGLAAAHASDVIHRDFKPENVVVDDAKTTKSQQARPTAHVTDFGLARPEAALSPSERDVNNPTTGPVSQDARWLSEAVTQGLHGTPAYLSPEQLDGKKATARSDQFSFAVALFEVLFGGSHPFGIGAPNGPKTLAAVREVMRKRVERPYALAKMPAYVWPVLERALRENPDERWPSMEELADELAGPDEKTRKLTNMLVASLTVAAVVHVAVFAILAVAVVSSMNDPPETGPAHVADVVVGVILLMWAPFCLPLALASAYGIARHRRWAYVTTIVYAVLSMPTCVGTPFSLFAAYALTRRNVRRVFGFR
jgi:eukaryotic-like serine/threonine-protein kinase